MSSRMELIFCLLLFDDTSLDLDTSTFVLRSTINYLIPSKTFDGFILKDTKDISSPTSKSNSNYLLKMRAKNHLDLLPHSLLSLFDLFQRSKTNSNRVGQC